MAKQRPRVRPPRRGDVYLVALGPAVGAEIQKTRPAVVIQNDSANRATVTSHTDRRRVDEYWIVNGRHRTVTVLSLGPHGYDAGQTVIAGSLRSRVLPKLRVPVAKLFER